VFLFYKKRGKYEKVEKSTHHSVQSLFDVSLFVGGTHKSETDEYLEDVLSSVVDYYPQLFFLFFCFFVFLFFCFFVFLFFCFFVFLFFLAKFGYKNVFSQIL
jgi:hypothetical protein